ncbi:MAG TPA: PAS domain S-box protein [Myxococcales bacterium]|nr:PAS domain S-box protein [Myxococcales bacterium]
MRSPRTPLDEAGRLHKLGEYEILDTAPEPSLDGLAALAAHVAGVPMALISLVDADRQWLKSRHGLDVPEIRRDVSFCGHVVEGGAPVAIPDALLDDRFADSPLVTGPPHVRFYLGLPLRTPDGFVVGTLCAMDRVPRELTQAQRGALDLLARQVVDRLELRRQALERDRRARGLERLNERLRAATEASGVGVWDWDTVHNRLEWDDQMYRIYGRPREQFSGAYDAWESGLHPADMLRARADVQSALESKVPFDTDFRVIWQDGTVRHLKGRALVERDAAGHAVRMVGTNWDITDVKQAQAALAASEARFRSIVESAIDAIIIIDEGGAVQQANPAVQRLFGHSPAELVGENVRVLLCSPDREWHDEHLAEQVRAGAPGVAGTAREVVAERKDGSTFPAELALSELRLDGRRYFTWVARDITSQKQVERLQSEFISTVSHELRTPLTSIRGSLGLVAGGVTGELPAEAREYVGIALSGTERLVRLINDILDIEKMQSGRVELRLLCTPLEPAITSVIASSHAFAASHRVQLRVPSAIPPGEVLVDSDRLAQVLTNLVSNAVKFSPPDSVVEISASVQQGRVHVAVKDQGPGIPEQFRDRIFQRFAQADSSTTRHKGGTGLGLSISKAIIEKMRGRIGFEPAGDRGAIFSFDLPYYPPVAAGEAASPRRGLVCEDDPEVMSVLARLLASAGFDAHLAPTVERARRLLAAHRYDVITLDLVLADGEAVSLVGEVRSSDRGSDVPILVVTGSGSRLGATTVLVTDVILKPFDEARLLSAIERAVSGHAAAGGGEAAPRLLHVEDEEDIRKVIRRSLPAHWSVTAASTLESARKAMAESAFDVIVLDLALPDGDGYQLLDLAGAAQVIIFSASEAPAEVARRVSASLVKATASAADVRDTILALLSRARRPR